MTDKLTVHESAALAMPVDGLKDIEKIGAWFGSSGMFGISNPVAGNIMALACYCEKINPIEMKRKYHIIDGNLSMRADYMLAEFNARGGKHKIISRTAELASVALEKDGEVMNFELSFEDAKKEPFVFKKDSKTLKKNWATDRARMQTLWARVVSDGVRAIDPGVVAGVYTPEELGDDGQDRPAGRIVDLDPSGIESNDGATTTENSEVVEPDKVEPPKEPTAKEKKAAAAKAKREANEKEEAEKKAAEKNDEAEVDCTVMPKGKMKGTKFSDMSLTHLEKLVEVFDKHEEITDGHLEVIKSEIEKLKNP